MGRDARKGRNEERASRRRRERERPLALRTGHPRRRAHHPSEPPASQISITFRAGNQLPRSGNDFGIKPGQNSGQTLKIQQRLVPVSLTLLD